MSKRSHLESMGTVLAALFQYIPARSILSQKEGISAQSIPKSIFQRFAQAHMKNLNAEEQEYFFDCCRETLHHYVRDIEHIKPPDDTGIHVFDMVRYYAHHLIGILDNTICCHYRYLPEWRNITLQLSEDLLICSYCAQHKTPSEMREFGFSWPLNIGHDNCQLNRIIEHGLAENHCHLFGAAPVFHLAWLSLMNDPFHSHSIHALIDYSEQQQNEMRQHESAHPEDSLLIQCQQAALIRLYLYAHLTHTCIDPRFNMVSSYLDDPSGYKLQGIAAAIQSTIMTLRNSYPYPVWSKPLEDYALLGVQNTYYSHNNKNDIFKGERWFLYTCLYHIQSSRFTPKQENLFYAYLVIREKIRSELIQSNKNVGFANFRTYEKRKFALIDDAVYQNSIVRTAVQESLLNDNIRLLELRISPGDTVKENLKGIQKLDKIIGPQKEKYCYTVHFLKEPDQAPDPDTAASCCRHYHLRRKIWRQAQALIQLRELHAKDARRIRGIDAASTEIGCRPEVFAPIFRYLHMHTKKDLEFGPFTVPQLRITYHVGEDFLDIVDGLRAIDETVNFLNMNCGDRMGHATVLGIDIDAWYQSKNKIIRMAKQDFLDNLVWMHAQMSKLYNTGLESLREYIHDKFVSLSEEIYLKYMDSSFLDAIIRNAEGKVPHTLVPRNYHFDIQHFYKAWKLRGDEPSLYKRGYFFREHCDDNWDQAMVNSKFPRHFESRYIPEIFLLHYFYQYDYRVRRTGMEPMEEQVPDCYIQGAKLIQKLMQERISYLGIGIETNPTSNLRISMMNRYSDHPIFQLYNKDLTFDPKLLTDCPQLSVSINTDDMGVFCTSLENEYAVLACALERQKDADGAPKYNRTMIYHWIEEVRKMGLEQSFRAE